MAIFSLAITWLINRPSWALGRVGYNSHWIAFSKILRHSLRYFLLPNFHHSRLSLYLSLRCCVRVSLHELQNEITIFSICSRCTEIRQWWMNDIRQRGLKRMRKWYNSRPRWGKLFMKHTTFWWGFLSTVIQVIYTFGYFEAVQVSLQKKSLVN